MTNNESKNDMFAAAILAALDQNIMIYQENSYFSDEFQKFAEQFMTDHPELNGVVYYEDTIINSQGEFDDFERVSDTITDIGQFTGSKASTYKINDRYVTIIYDIDGPYMDETFIRDMYEVEKKTKTIEYFEKIK